MDESPQPPVQQDSPSYWTSIAVAGLLFGIFVFALSIISAYISINSEPSGSYLTPSTIIGFLTCLIGAFGGMLATWHYGNIYEEGVVISLGRGALIGLLTGILAIIISTILSQLWHLIDPDMTQKMVDSTVAKLQAMDLPSDQKQKMIDSTVESMRTNQSFGRQLLWGIPIYGILNLITGMIGAKIFGKKEETV